MSGNDVLIGLRLGFDVIFDGNFTATAHDPLLEKWLSADPEENYLFYLDASLNETLKRQETKSLPRISTDKMKEVYQYAAPTGHAKEVIIPASSSLEQTVEQIAQITGI